MNRRKFLVTGAAALSAGCVIGGQQCGGKACPKGAACGGKGGRILFGACRPLSDTALMKSIGYDFVERSFGEMFVPDKGEEAWKHQKEAIVSAALPLRSCNGFLPGRFRVTGENADWAPILEYAEVGCRRADEVGLKTMVFGSGGARNVPVTYHAGGKIDYPKGFDVERGRDQYAEFCAVLAKRIAGCRVTVVIEPLRPNETDIIHYVWQGLQIVEEVGSPRIQQLADIFHMMMGREPAESIVKAGDRLRHCHIADWKTRLFPGQDPAQTHRLKPYFDALKEIGYSGGVSCECGWGEKGDLAKNLETALKTMKGLAS